MRNPPFVIFLKREALFPCGLTSPPLPASRTHPAVPNVAPSVKRQGIKNGGGEGGCERLSFVYHKSP
jgi:hypothetical protein